MIFFDPTEDIDSFFQRLQAKKDYLVYLLCEESKYLNFPVVSEPLFNLKEQRQSFIINLLKFIVSSSVYLLASVHTMSKIQFDQIIRLTANLQNISNKIQKVILAYKKLYLSSYLDSLDRLKTRKDTESSQGILNDTYKCFLKEMLSQLVFLRCTQGLRHLEGFRSFVDGLKMLSSKILLFVEEDTSESSIHLSPTEQFVISPDHMLPKIDIGKLRAKSCNGENDESPITDRSCQDPPLRIEIREVEESVKTSPNQTPTSCCDSMKLSKKQLRKRSKRIKKFKEAMHAQEYTLVI